MSDDSQFQSFDGQLFESEAWRPDHGLSAQFKDVTLKVQVGEFAAGTKFPFAVIQGDASVLVLVDEQQEQHVFRLGLSVGEKVDTSEMECQDENCTHHH